MKSRSILALGGALVALALLGAAPALAASSTKVTVRVEGLKRTLLETKAVHVSSSARSITKGGAPAGTCPGNSGAGALNDATRGRWDGKYSSGLGIEVTKILGERHVYSPNGYYWSIWVDNRFATAGICDLKLHRGEQLLFAPYPAKGAVYPLVLAAPRHATVGRAFRVRAYYYNSHNRLTPLRGLHIRGASGTTDGRGYLRVTPTRRGRLVLSASHRGFIRSARLTVRVA